MVPVPPEGEKLALLVTGGDFTTVLTPVTPAARIQALALCFGVAQQAVCAEGFLVGQIARSSPETATSMPAGFDARTPHHGVVQTWRGRSGMR